MNMNIFTHALIDADGVIERLMDRAPVSVDEGLTAVELDQAQPHWPQPPYAGAEPRVVGGALLWVDTRTVSASRADKWAAIKEARSTFEFSGFTWDGSAFDSDAQAQARIQGGVQLATIAASQAQPFSIDWTLADNSVRTLSGVDMVAVGMALAQHVQLQHSTARTLRAQIEAATTVAEVEAVTWPS